MIFNKNIPTVCYLLETILAIRIHINGKGLKKILHANGKEKRAGVAIIISDKIEFSQNWSREAKKFTI